MIQATMSSSESAPRSEHTSPSMPVNPSVKKNKHYHGGALHNAVSMSRRTAIRVGIGAIVALAAKFAYDNAAETITGWQMDQKDRLPAYHASDQEMTLKVQEDGECENWYTKLYLPMGKKYAISPEYVWEATNKVNGINKADRNFWYNHPGDKRIVPEFDKKPFDDTIVLDTTPREMTEEEKQKEKTEREGFQLPDILPHNT